ncbi:hypothetical protein [Ancylobacter oerskovii]|uniref:Uncharacterized protein n=1 Tax=Ancylobacter oerskovii TaxID=459519 RepID=A0ABW4Z2M7_9HYPH|nr:hypothetical protein [Ancylobacter oerskovii]MBS7546278.1 hypothetical protein [Ancylobacter oerskovii]
MLPNGKQSRCITSGGAIWWSAEINDGDHNQIVIFDFTGPCIELSDLRALFLDFRHQHPDVPADNVVALLAYGYPTKGRNYDADARHIELGQCFVLCRFIGGGSDDAVHVIAPLKPLSFDPDGMSGGAAFCLLHDTEGFSIHLAGVIVRGGQHRLRLIKAGAVQMVLEEFIRSRPL